MENRYCLFEYYKFSALIKLPINGLKRNKTLIKLYHIFTSIENGSINNW